MPNLNSSLKFVKGRFIPGKLVLFLRPVQYYVFYHIPIFISAAKQIQIQILLLVIELCCHLGTEYMLPPFPRFSFIYIYIYIIILLNL